MSIPAKKLLTAGAGASQLYVEDVFSTYVRTGTGAEVTVTNNIDATKGFMLHSKSRSVATDHAVYDSARGVTLDLVTNSTAAETTQAQGLKSFNDTSYTIGTLAKINTSGATYVDWFFRNAFNFFQVLKETKVAGSDKVIDLSQYMDVVGVVRVRRAEAAQTGSWYAWHRSLTPGQLLIGETTAAAATLGHITVSGTTLTLVNGIITDGDYHIEVYAHDPDPDTGVIQCGSFTSGVYTDIGWEAQFILAKRSDGVGPWYIFDTMRGLPVIGSTGNYGRALYPNASDAEADSNAINLLTSTGFTAAVGGAGIFMAIRRPMKVPTVGTGVYNAISRTGTGAAAALTGAGFAPDLWLSKERAATVQGAHAWWTRLIGIGRHFRSTGLSTLQVDPEGVTAFTNDGGAVGTDASQLTINAASKIYINHFFRRAPEFMEVIHDIGTLANKTEKHGLKKQPELWLRRCLSTSTEIVIGSTLMLATEKVVMYNSAGRVTDATVWNSAYPTDSLISIGSSATVNASALSHITVMFATVKGVSKVGLFTGNGTTQTLDCRFSTGARFIMIIRLTAGTSQDIFIWDSTRGIVAGDDPHLSINTLAAEVTTDDSIDPDASGFIVNQVAATNINVTSAEYMFLAIA